MKILHLISGGDIGGAKTHVLTLLRGLQADHRVVLGCFLEGRFVQEARAMGIPSQVWSGGNAFTILKKVTDFVRREQFDLIHCHGAKGNVIGIMLRKKVGLPVISTVHSDPWLDYMGRPAAELIYGRANRWAMRRMDALVCVSDVLRQRLIEKGFDPYGMFCNENGVDFSNLPEPKPRTDFLNELGLDWPEDAVIFGVGARLNPVKDIGALLRAFSAVQQQIPSARLLIAGDGEQRSDLEKLAAQLCPAGTVHFAGWIENMDRFYQALDVNVLSSLSEGFPYAIPEGARMRCATAATRVGAVPGVVIHGQTGLLSEPGDVDALRNNLLLLAKDGALRKRFGQAIFDRVRREYSLEACVARQETIYQRVLARSQRRLSRRDGVVICGANGRHNVGDDAILLSMLQELRQGDPELPIWVMTRKPRETAMMAQVSTLYTFDFLRAGKTMHRARLYISGGGSLIQDVTSTRSLQFYLHSIRQAKGCGCQVMMYGCGVGPVVRRRNQVRTAKTLNRCVDVITLRDPESARTLRKLGVTRPNIQVTADPALLCPKDMTQAEQYWKAAGLRPDGNYCMFALRPWAGEQQWSGAFAAAADYVWQTYGMEPVFFSMEEKKDQQVTERIAARVKAPSHILPPTGGGSLICGVISRMRLVVSMRLHALIFATGQGVPVVGISYDPKVESFLDYLGQENYVSLEAVSDGALCDLIDSAVSGAVAEEAVLTRLRALASQNGKEALALLEKRSNFA